MSERSCISAMTMRVTVGESVCLPGCPQTIYLCLSVYQICHLFVDLPTYPLCTYTSIYTSIYPCIYLFLSAHPPFLFFPSPHSNACLLLSAAHRVQAQCRKCAEPLLFVTINIQRDIHVIRPHISRWCTPQGNTYKEELAIYFVARKNLESLQK